MAADYRFPGERPFLKAAVADRPDADAMVGRAGSDNVLRDLGSLLGQAAEARPDARAGILAAAEDRLAILEFRAVAGRAMMAEVRTALGLDTPPLAPTPAKPTAPTGPKAK